MKFRNYSAVLCCGLILLALTTRWPKQGTGATAPADSSPPVTFTDVTKAAGINFVNVSSPDKKYIVESMSGGVAFFDFDNDGRLDIYLVNSNTVEAALAGKPRPRAALYRNRGDGTFEEVAAKAGVADP